MQTVPARDQWQAVVVPHVVSMAHVPLLLLVDGHSLAFRSYYAFNKQGNGLSTRSGVPTSVTYGFLKTLLETAQEWQPDGVVIAFDTDQPTFRHQADATYKANRDEAPDDFLQDMVNLQTILAQAMGLPVCTAPGFEADDVIGTVANLAVEQGWRVRILSGDRDLFQLVDDHRDIVCLYTGSGPYARSGPRLIDVEGVRQKLGVGPDRVVDLKSLTGDSSDNIPGVKGVGPKTAIALLDAHGNLGAIYDAIDSLKPAVARKLVAGRESAFRSRLLAEIRCDVPLPQPPNLLLATVDAAVLGAELLRLELHSLRRQLDAFVTCFSTTGHTTVGSAAAISQGTADSDGNDDSPRPALRPSIITEIKALDALVGRLQGCRNPAEPVALDTETTALNPFQAQLVGLGFCWGPGAADLAYIPIAHGDGRGSQQLALDGVLQSLAPWLASADHPKCLQNAKYDRLILLRHGLTLQGVVMDTMLAHYLLDPVGRHNLEDMAEHYFGFRPQSYSDLVGQHSTIAEVDVAAAACYCAMDVHLTRRLAPILREALAADGGTLESLFTTVELPLEPVLALMEATGIRIDGEVLKTLSHQLEQQLDTLRQQAAAAAGCAFNLASPKQLADLLFQTLQLDKRKSRKTKTGYSTDATVLERLVHDHPVVPLILEHRTLSKLKNTYVDALPALVEPETARVHTDFNQAVTATGRLSSSHPNLQNIPIRSSLSRQVRRAFLPQEGWELISADYSQIELRILAHLCQEPLLVEAYNNDKDVHALTARLLLEKDDVSNDERRLGKTINFGVIYGMGPQRFARETGVPLVQAQEFLSRYRQRYPRVFTFLEEQERLALSRGYVETLLGRRRVFHFERQGLGQYRGRDPQDIDLQRARRRGMEGQMLRAAANAPIQGSSADIIKLAMVQLHQALGHRPAHLLLQVHDELVLEVHPDVRHEVMAVVRQTMETAVALSVPLKVEMGIGANWMAVK